MVLVRVACFLAIHLLIRSILLIVHLAILFPHGEISCC